MLILFISDFFILNLKSVIGGPTVIVSKYRNSKSR